jgi:teichoic acid transport system ATP-binding protein
VVAREIQALRGISLVACVVGVVGANGAGKTTLLRAVAGLPPAQGRVYAWRQAARLAVNAALLDDLTGARNITPGCLAMGMTRGEARDIYDQIDVIASSCNRAIWRAARCRWTRGLQAFSGTGMCAAATQDKGRRDEYPQGAPGRG